MTDNATARDRIAARLRRLVLGAAHRLTLPLRILYYGHIPYVIFVVGLLCAVYYGFNRAEVHLLAWVEIASRDFGASPAAYQKLRMAASLLLWTCSLPIVITVMALPAYHVYAARHILIPELVKSFLPRLQACCHSLGITVSSALYLTSPALVLVLGYLFWARKLQADSINQIYIITCLLVCGMTLVRTLPVLFTPVITACSRYAPRQALSLSQIILSSRRWYLLLLTAAAAAVSAGIHISLTGYARNVCFIVCGWYFFTQACVLVLTAVFEFEKNQAAQRHAATVQQTRAYGFDQASQAQSNSGNPSQHSQEDTAGPEWDDSPDTIRVENVVISKG